MNQPVAEVMLDSATVLGLFCLEHARQELSRLDGNPTDGQIFFCEAVNAKGESCAASPAHRVNGHFFCAAHYRKMMLGQETAE